MRVWCFQATINVGGRAHSAMSIEHFILRLPYSVVKQVREATGPVALDTAEQRAGRSELPQRLVGHRTLRAPR